MRYKELDVARGFTVMMMPAVHVTMLYGNAAVYRSWLGSFLNWIAVFPGAQLFMLLMGISFTLSHKKDTAQNIGKTGSWLLVGYLLNGCKFLIPAGLGWLPSAFFQSLNLSPGWHASIRLLVIGDILQLAAISLGMLMLVNKYVQSKWPVIFLCILIMVVSPFAWQIKTADPIGNEMLSLVTGNDPLVFFPFFPWLVYPLAGYLLGKQLNKAPMNYRTLSIIGLFFMVPGMMAYGLLLPGENLYRSLPLQTLYHLGFCFVWLFVCSFIAKIIQRTLFFNFMSWCSRHITIIYCTQWILIFWCISFLPYRGLNIVQTFFIIFLLSATVISITWLLSNRMKRINARKHETPGV